jgi:DNA polymerase-3 subunit epsilon
LNEPSEAISTQITAITGITNELVEGRRIDPAFVTSFVEGASLIIAHNAAFDRPIAERIAPVFASKPWACSMSDVPWHDEGFQSRRLADLLAHYGLFFNSHRATDDCEAGVALLTMRLPKSNDRVLEVLLRSARTPTWRIFAVDSPFDRREKLKRRSYRWNSNSDFGPKSWWIDVVGERVDDELAYLEREVFGRAVRLPIFEITAYQRYSARSR